MLYDTQIQKVSVSARFWTLLEVIPNLTLIVVLGFGAYAAGHGLVTLGTLVAFITMMLSLVWPIASLGFLLSMTQEAMTAANRIAEIFDAPLEITDGPRSADARAAAGWSSIDVGFRFPDSDPDDRPELGAAPRQPHRRTGGDAGPGRRHRLGQVGAGRAAAAALRRHRGRDPHRRHRHPGPVAAGAAHARWPSPSRTRRCSRCRWPRTCGWAGPDDPARRRDLAQAIEIAAAQFVYDLPYGLQTRIGEQGMSLSGGQRQRLSLARAILAAPTILVLDDTLSALDVHTEATVTEALRRVLAGVTGVVVAHRASTVLLADKVALLDTSTGRPPSPTSAPTPNCWPTVPRYRYLLAADDELDDGCEPQPDWEDDDARQRLDRAYEEACEQREADPPPGRLRGLRRRRPMTADRVARPARRAAATTCRSTRRVPRRREARALLGSLLRPYRSRGRRCWPWWSSWKTLRGCLFRCWCSAASTTPSRRCWPAARRAS